MMQPLMAVYMLAAPLYLFDDSMSQPPIRRRLATDNIDAAGYAGTPRPPDEATPPAFASRAELADTHICHQPLMGQEKGYRRPAEGRRRPPSQHAVTPRPQADTDAISHYADRCHCEAATFSRQPPRRSHAIAERTAAGPGQATPGRLAVGCRDVLIAPRQASPHYGWPRGQDTPYAALLSADYCPPATAA